MSLWRYYSRRKINSIKDCTTPSNKDSREIREAHKNRGHSCMASIARTLRGNKIFGSYKEWWKELAWIRNRHSAFVKTVKVASKLDNRTTIQQRTKPKKSSDKYSVISADRSRPLW